MKCVKCGANYGSELVKCPYCGEINHSATEFSNTLKEYAEDYKKTEQQLTDKGGSKVLKAITIILIILYAVILALTIFITSQMNKVVTGQSSLVKNSPTQKKNEELYIEFVEKGEYARALKLVDDTDLSMYADELTGFEYYSDFSDGLEAIFPYVNIYNEVLFILSDMEAGNDYRSLTSNQLISYEIFYYAPESELKEKLRVEVEGYLKNLYMLTDEEISNLRTIDDYQKFRIDGSTNIEAITKERMVEHFGK